MTLGCDRKGSCSAAHIQNRLTQLKARQAEKVLAELIAGEFGKDFRSRRKASGQISPDLLVQYVASTFILVLNWWLESRSPLLPKEVNDLFRALILPTLAATWG